MEMVAKAANDRSTVGSEEKVGARDDGTWGPCDIVKKGVEIYRCNACVFSLIHLTVVLPCTILWLLNQHYTRILIHTFMPGRPCEDPCPAPAPSPGPSPDEWQCVVAFVVLLFLGFVFWVNVVGSLYYSVGTIYASKTITYKDVVKQLPCLWNGLIVTGLWGYVFVLVVAVAVFLIGSVFMTFSSVSFLPLPVACFLVFVISVVTFFYVGSSTQMANGVTVFEQTCGLPTFCKALQLLKRKWCVAFGLALIFAIPQVILVVIINAATWAWSAHCAKWLAFGVLATVLAIVLELSVMSSALFYLSAKQSKQESISVDHFSFSEGYQSVAAAEHVV